MGDKSPGTWVKFWNSLLLEIMAKLMKMRGGRHTSRVRMSMLLVVLPRWRSPGLSCSSVSFSQRFFGKRTEGTDFLWGCYWHRSTSAMWIFKSSYLISFWFAGIIWCTHIFHQLVVSAHLFMKMTSCGNCVSAYNSSGEPIFCPEISWIFRIDSVVLRVWSCCSHFGGGCPERGLLVKEPSRLLLRVRFSLICIVDLFLGQLFVVLVFAGDAEFAPGVRKRWRINWGGNWWSDAWYR